MVPARKNPFATGQVLQLRYQFRESAGDGWPQFLGELKLLSYRAAIIGPHGSGKTTLLEDLGVRLQREGFRIHPVFLNEQNRDYPSEFVRRIRDHLTSQDIVLLDGCEQLSFHNWWRFRWQLRRAGGLVITSHRSGRLPTLRDCETSACLLADLIDQLLGAASSIERLQVEQLFLRHRGNVRNALRELYDLAALGEVFPTGNPTHHS
jgi:hypothetical protein